MRLTSVRALSAAGLLLAAYLPPVRAQPAAAPPAFEVASVKPSTSGLTGVRGGCHGIDFKYSQNEAATAPSPGRCMISDARLSHLIVIAYGLNSISGMSGIGLIENAPDWVINGDERFTIQAKAEDPTNVTQGQLLEMLQTLLAERFKLKFHRQNREIPGFALVVARSGPKLQEAKGDETSKSSASSMKPLADGPVTVNARRYSMGLLASLLSDLGPGGPVEDHTELSGVYDFKLSWNDSTGPSVFTALQEQLGLRLERTKVAVSFFVFESAERPGEN